MTTTSTLSDIQVMSESAFSSVTTTDDSKLYFVEDNDNITINPLATSGTITLSDNSINTITPSAAVTFTLPSVDTTSFHQILVQVNMSSVKTMTLGTTYYFNKTAPNMSTAGTYNLLYEYDGVNNHWVVGCVAKGTA